MRWIAKEYAGWRIVGDDELLQMGDVWVSTTTFRVVDPAASPKVSENSVAAKNTPRKMGRSLSSTYPPVWLAYRRIDGRRVHIPHPIFSKPLPLP